MKLLLGTLSFAFSHLINFKNRHYRALSSRLKFPMQFDSKPDSEHSLASFLRDHSANYFRSPGQCCHIFIGNEAADADSILSALCFSYFSYRENCTDSQKFYVPLVSIPSSDIPLRREVSIILQSAGVNIHELHSMEDFAFDSPQSMKISLLDHNSMNRALRKKLNICKNYEVVEIIDHHVDAGDHLEVQGLSRCIAFEGSFPLVGSSCTLVFEKGLNLFTPQSFPRDVAHILLGVIVIDTLNMDEKANKGTARDQRAIEELMQILQLSEDAKNAYYESLMQCKMDPSFWGEISCYNCLNFDFKQFDWAAESIGFSSVLLPITELLNKPNSLDNMKTFMENSQLKILIVMSLCNATTIPERELLIVSRSSLLVHTIADKLFTEQTLPLQLTELQLSEEIAQQSVKESISLMGYKQGNLKASRKQLAPLICSYAY